MSSSKNKARDIFKRAVDKGDYKKGIKEMNKLIDDKEVEDEEILYNLAFLYDHYSFDLEQNERKKMEEKAINLYKKVLEINPDYYNAIWGIARIYGYRKSKKALPYAKKAYEKHKKESGNEDFAQNVASIYNILGDYKKAEKWYKKPLDKTDQPGMFANIVNFYRKTNQLEKIESYLKKGKELFKRKPKFFKKSLVGQRIKEALEEKKRDNC